jgi:HAD superfamily hydrolase (TIGR01544 family)
MSTSTALLKNLLKNEKVKIKNENKVQNKLDLIKSTISSNSLKPNLYIITDFDATISMHHNPNDLEKKKLPGTMTVLENDKTLCQEVLNFCRENVKYYYPLEMSLEITEEEKLKHMVKWWSSSLDKVINNNSITVNSLKETCLNSSMKLRKNVDNFFKILTKNNISCLIFSAGCGTVIEQTLKYKEPICWADNMIVCSNNLIFESSENGSDQKLIGYDQPLIHSLNKSHALDRLAGIKGQEKYRKLVSLLSMESIYEKQSQIEKEDFKLQHQDSGVASGTNSPIPSGMNSFKNKSDEKFMNNAIVIGDHIKDVNMRNGMENLIDETVLNIGFLNVKFEENLEKYMDVYDIVLVDDMEFDRVNEILNWII